MTVRRSVMLSTRPSVSPMRTRSPITNWSSITMRKPPIQSRTRFCAPKPSAKVARPATASMGVTFTPNSGSAVRTATTMMTVEPTLARIPASVRICCSRICAAREGVVASFTIRRESERTRRTSRKETSRMPARREPLATVQSVQRVKRVFIEMAVSPKPKEYIIGWIRLSRVRASQPGGGQPCNLLDVFFFRSVFPDRWWPLRRPPSAGRDFIPCSPARGRGRIRLI